MESVVDVCRPPQTLQRMSTCISYALLRRMASCGSWMEGSRYVQSRDRRKAIWVDDTCMDSFPSITVRLASTTFWWIRLVWPRSSWNEIPIPWSLLCWHWHPTWRMRNESLLSCYLRRIPPVLPWNLLPTRQEFPRGNPSRQRMIQPAVKHPGSADQ